MRTALAAVIGVVTAALLGEAHQPSAPQGRRPRGAADGGSPADGGPPARAQKPYLLGTDPPGKLRRFTSDDGGTVARVADAGPGEVERELIELRARVRELELERAERQAQAEQLLEMNQQLQALRGQVADAEASRQEAQRQEALHQRAVQGAISGLYQAQELLAGGSSSVDAQLDAAASNFTGQAQRDVQSARAALQNRDLSQARAYLGAAITDAEQGR